MKITTKINLLTTAWLVFILLIMNVLVFFTFMKTIGTIEERFLNQKAHEIIKRTEKKGPEELTKDLLEVYLSDHSFIRIVDKHSAVIKQITDDTELANVQPEFTRKEKSELRQIGEEQFQIVRVPISINHNVSYSMEIAQRVTGLEVMKDKLLSILAACSGITLLLSLAGGTLLSSVIMKPISRIIRTMEDIEQSGVPKTIFIQNRSKDELYTLANTFNRMISRLQENIKRQKQFASDASHELKTPITVIGSYADLLLRRGVNNVKHSKDAIEAIHQEAMRMQKMTETLLDLASSENETSIDVGKVNLTQVCENLVMQLQSVYKREILLHKENKPVIVEADELKMKQVIIIVLDNASKYSKSKIEVTVGEDEGDAFIRVKDSGVGIPEEDLDNIFERFYRVDKARSRETGGTGLGLSIAKTIMKLHRGDIFIQSKEGKGTEVELRIPVLFKKTEGA
ncbi:HAMP domain-containing sensor histidine kinase [Fictibacillus sp. S7]|uniref:HAMP domain-containing sensor histidine kinase n=1 Tax=Fictibacillus sp. S7 TaxID=2212476 RepID=UPI0010138FD8|nr:HAMP domain-containing histidine kinase [Fictibacillus sp. S7]RXY98425.1 two-component sensor histidine kinase [Fictibacillus sp. S7]